MNHVKEKPMKTNGMPPVDASQTWKSVCSRPRKFNDSSRLKFLDFLEQHGKRVLACQYVDISFTTLQNTLEEDESFRIAFSEALARRSERIAQHIEAEAMAGTKDISFDKEGKVTRERNTFESNIRLAILKRHGDGYVDKVDVTSNQQQVGAVVVPASLSIDEWKEKYGSKSETSDSKST